MDGTEADPSSTKGDIVKHNLRNFGAIAAIFITLVSTPEVFAHGDVVPQAVDTTGLKNLGAGWQAANPFRKDKTAIRIGDSAFNQNCARCHGLGAISGGIAPDLRSCRWVTKVMRCSCSASAKGLCAMAVFTCRPLKAP
jgi:hypothetical protein